MNFELVLYALPPNARLYTRKATNRQATVELFSDEDQDSGYTNSAVAYDVQLEILRGV